MSGSRRRSWGTVALALALAATPGPVLRAQDDPLADYAGGLQAFLSSWAGHGVEVLASADLGDRGVLAIFGLIPDRERRGETGSEAHLAEDRQRLEEARQACEARAATPAERLGCADLLGAPALSADSAPEAPCERLDAALIDTSARAPAVRNHATILPDVCDPTVTLPQLGDLDANGREEAVVQVRHREAASDGASDATEYREWLLLELDDLTVQARVLLDREPPSGPTRTAHAAFTDLDGDGHPDLVVFVKVTEPADACAADAGECATHHLESLRYEPDGDTWVEAPLEAADVPVGGLPCPDHPDCPPGTACRCDTDGQLEPAAGGPAPAPPP